MVGVTSTLVKESAEELTQRLKESTTAREKDKLQVLYWLYFARLQLAFFTQGQ